jgi:plastocyanin
MFRERFTINSRHQASVLPQRAIACLGLLLVGLVSGLFDAPIRPLVAGEAAVPIVEVRLTEFSIEMLTTVPPGPVSFSVTNAGTMEHNFEIKSQGIEKKFDTSLKAGETRTLKADLTDGTYTIYCPLDDHKARGMHLELKVAQQQTADP